MDEKGNLIDGDKIIAALAVDMKDKGELPGDAAVVTVMSNLGFFRFCEQNGISPVSTKVGDRYVLEEMVKNGYAIGGEQSGHIIFLRHATTGDGQLSAVKLLSMCRERGQKLSRIGSMMERYPQVLINIPVADNDRKKAVMASQALADAVAAEEEKLAGEGRVLVRPSGTEALMRVMVEARDQDTAQAAAQRLADQIAAL